MATGMIEIMKMAAMDAIENGKPCDVRVGTVTSVSPLKIKINDELILPESVLIVPEHLTDYTVGVSFNWDTHTVSNHSHSYSGSVNSGGDPAHGHSFSGNTKEAGSHKHTLSSDGDKSITIHNALQLGDMVSLIRTQGGKQYYILDRV